MSRVNNAAGATRKKVSDVSVTLALGIADAARACGLGRSSVWALVKQGQLPVVMIGRRTVIRVGALDEWLAKHEVTRNQ